MASAADSLPDDIEALRAFALNAIAERDAAIEERDTVRAECDKLQSLYEHVRHLLRKANDARFGAKSEKLAKLPGPRAGGDQLALALEDIEVAIAKTEAIEEKKQPQLPRLPRRKRGALPAHLPRIHRTVTPEKPNCPCCKTPMHVIGEETSERLDMIPAQYRVIVTHRPKLACRSCEKIVQALAPEHLIKSGLPTEGMVASVLVAKYGWHCRSIARRRCLGFEASTSTARRLPFGWAMQRPNWPRSMSG